MSQEKFDLNKAFSYLENPKVQASLLEAWKEGIVAFLNYKPFKDENKIPAY